VRYALACLYCGAPITIAEHVRDAEIAAVQRHLRAEHPDLLPAGRHEDGVTPPGS
jgi:hypothetical protein